MDWQNIVKVFLHTINNSIKYKILIWLDVFLSQNKKKTKINEVIKDLNDVELIGINNSMIIIWYYKVKMSF
jgi:hypothetical protein